MPAPNSKMSAPLAKDSATRAHCRITIDDFTNPEKRTKSQYRLIFTYGTLKSGEPNNWIINQREKNICGTLLAKARTIRRYPLVVATTYKVPFMVDAEGYGHFVEGEICAVDEETLRFLDLFEGHPELYFRRKEPVEITEVMIPNLHSVHGVKTVPNLRKLSLSDNNEKPPATDIKNGSVSKTNKPTSLLLPGGGASTNQNSTRRSSLLPPDAGASAIPTTPSIGRGGFRYTAPRVYHNLQFEHLKIKPGDIIECEAYFLQHYKHFFAKRKMAIACYTSSNKILGEFNKTPVRKPKVLQQQPTKQRVTLSITRNIGSICRSDSDDADDKLEAMEREEILLTEMMRKLIDQPWEEKFENASKNNNNSNWSP